MTILSRLVLFALALLVAESSAQMRMELPSGSHESSLSGLSQNIIQQLERFRNPSLMSNEDKLYAGKCGFRLSFDLMSVWDELNQQEKNRARVLLQPTVMQKDTVIGRFRIHYDTTGTHEPALLDGANQRIPGTARAYIDSVGRIFNDVWQNEILTLGYIAPPIQSGDSYYNVYVQNLGPYLYGETVFPVDHINPGQTPPRYTSYLRIHNDFAPFYTKGMDALKVTAAHEFHHVVQVGSYGVWGNDLYFYEITSTWLEDVLYDEVNDYYQYIKTGSDSALGHFATPYRSLNVRGNLIEYSRAIWGKYVEKRYGASVMRRTWELMQQYVSLPALDRAFNEQGATLREAYEEFSLWNYFTGSRADSINYYTEAAQYPAIRLQDSLQFQSPISVFSPARGVESLGSMYLIVYLNPQRTRALLPIIVKANIAEAGNGTAERFQLTLRSDAGDGTYIRFVVDNDTYWAKLNGVNNAPDWSLFQAGTKVVPSAVLVYPNPFYAGSQSWIRFEVPDDNASIGNIFIFNSSMELVYSKEELLTPSAFRSRFFTWNGEANNGKGGQASSGVYIYLIEVGVQRYTGKFSLIRK